mgnify:CR=1 FL=1
MYMMNDREFSNRKETLHGEFYENALKYPETVSYTHLTLPTKLEV